MFPNKNYEKDIKYALELNRFFCRLLGIWPYMDKKFYILRSIERLSFILVCYFLLFWDLISMFLYIFLVEKRSLVRLKLIGPAMFTIQAIVKHNCLIFGNGQLKDCLRRVDDDWRNVASASARDTMISKARDGRRVLILCSTIMYIAGVYFRTIVPLSKGKIVTDQNVTIRHLACPAYFIIFDVQTSPAYEIVFFIQLFSGLAKYTVMVASCSLTALFAMHICAQLEILMELMNSLVNERKVEKVSKTLAMIVEHQNKARNFTQLVQETLQFVTLMEISGCAMNICIMLYSIITEWEDHNVIAMYSYLILLTSLVFNVFIFCFIGEQLSVEGEKLTLAASTLAWYRLPNVTARSWILVMIASNMPKKLKAGQFFELSFKTFGDVIKTSVAYLNLVRNVL